MTKERERIIKDLIDKFPAGIDGLEIDCYEPVIKFQELVDFIISERKDSAIKAVESVAPRYFDESICCYRKDKNPCKIVNCAGKFICKKLAELKGKTND